MYAVELVEDRPTKRSFAPARQIGLRVHQEAVDRGLLSRVKGDSYLLAPPLIITDEQLDRCVEILAASIAAVV